MSNLLFISAISVILLVLAILFCLIRVIHHPASQFFLIAGVTLVFGAFITVAMFATSLELELERLRRVTTKCYKGKRKSPYARRVYASCAPIKIEFGPCLVFTKYIPH